MRLIFIFLLLIFNCTNAFGKGEDIKGIRLGMPKDDVIRALGGETEGPAWNLNQQPWHYLWCMTIAEVYPKNECSSIFTFDEENRLVWVYWMFDPNEFENLRDALKVKFPKMRCTSNTVITTMGGRFQNQECVAGDIELSKYSSSVRNGYIQMIDRKWQRQDREKKAKERAKNL
jgi:hypothetical protein